MKIAVLSGDGISPEVTHQSVKILELLKAEGVPLELEAALIGGCAYDATGHPLPDATFSLAKSADAILFGAEGGLDYATARPAPLRRAVDVAEVTRSVRQFPAS